MGRPPAGREELRSGRLSTVVDDNADNADNAASDSELDGGGNGGNEKVERRLRFVPADPQAIFDLLADPSKHSLIDGSGTVLGSKSDLPERLELGTKFSMSMKMGVPYKMTNEVVEFEEPTLIAWRPMGGHIWRYRLRAVDGGTEVTEEFDWRPSRAKTLLKVTGTPKKNAAAIDATLDRLAEYFTTE